MTVRMQQEQLPPQTVLASVPRSDNITIKGIKTHASCRLTTPRSQPSERVWHQTALQIACFVLSVPCPCACEAEAACEGRPLHGVQTCVTCAGWSIAHSSVHQPCFAATSSRPFTSWGKKVCSYACGLWCRCTSESAACQRRQLSHNPSARLCRQPLPYLLGGWLGGDITLSKQCGKGRWVGEQAIEWPHGTTATQANTLMRHNRSEAILRCKYWSSTNSCQNQRYTGKPRNRPTESRWWRVRPN